MAEAKKDTGWDFGLIFALLIALGNLGFFGLMFTVMHYFELVGADPTYFDSGTESNLKIINMVTGIFGFHIDPRESPEISTLGFTLFFGLALVANAGAIMLANRRRNEAYEVTEATV